MQEQAEASILLAGATGAVGRQVLKLALEGDTYSTILVLTRRPLPELEGHEKVTQLLADLDSIEQIGDQLKARDVFCGLGTTRKKAGSKQALFQIDHDYPLKIAQLARDNGAERFFLISSLGANHRSWSHYLQTKGLLEEALKQLGYPHLVLLRPSLLLGEREEQRPGEEFGKLLNKVFAPLMPRRARGIHVARIAERILELGRSGGRGLQILESDQIPLPSGPPK